MLFEEFQDGRPSWISKWNDFSNSESLCHCDASHQVLAQSNFQFGRSCCKNFHGGHLGYWNGTILSILNLYVAPMPPIMLAQSDLCFWRRYCLKNGHLRYRNGTILAIMNLCVIVMLPIKFWLILTYGLGGDVD